MKKKNDKNDFDLDRLMKALSIEVLPAEELKKPVKHPERFDMFMKLAVRRKKKKKQ